MNRGLFNRGRLFHFPVLMLYFLDQLVGTEVCPSPPKLTIMGDAPLKLTDLPPSERGSSSVTVPEESTEKK